MKLKLTNFSLRFPWIIVLLVLIAVIFGATQFPKVQFDNDPENMLSPDEPVRIFHNQNKANYALYDMVIVGIVNTNNPDGVFNVDTLGRIDVLTRQLLSLRQNADGLPEITVPHAFTPDLQPESARKRTLAQEGHLRVVKGADAAVVQGKASVDKADVNVGDDVITLQSTNQTQLKTLLNTQQWVNSITITDEKTLNLLAEASRLVDTLPTKKDEELETSQNLKQSINQLLQQLRFLETYKF